MRRVLLLLALAACSSPTGPDQTEQIDEITTAAQAGVSDYELHIVKNRGADNAYTGQTLSAGTYWVRLERKDNQWDGIPPNSRLSPGVDSVVFVIDGQKTRERLHPYEAKPIDWSNGSHSVKWTLYGYSTTTQTLTVQVGNNPAPTPDPDPAPDPTPDPGSYDVVIKPGQSIQSAVNANSTGTKFLIKSGTHYGQQVTPKNDQKFYGESGTVLDGNGKEYAFGGYGIPGARVLIQGIEIKNYNPKELYLGAIQGDNAVDWTVDGNVIHHIRGVGIRLGRGMTARNNHTYANTNNGIAGFKANGAKVIGNEINGNGAGGRKSEHGGLKILDSSNLVLRGNHSHHNTGKGLWLDTDVIDAIIEDNLVTDNTFEGIWIEVACRATIRNNTSIRNGLSGIQQYGWPNAAGIQVVNGTDVEIYGNTVSGNLNGIAVLGATGYPARDCTPRMRNVRVHDNVIAMSRGATGATDNRGDVDYSTIKFYNNTYTINTSNPFIWRRNRIGINQWKAAGNDTGGTFK